MTEIEVGVIKILLDICSTYENDDS